VQVQPLAKAVQDATGAHVTLVYVDQGYTGDVPAEAAAAEGIELPVVKLPGAKHRFVPLPRRSVAELSFDWRTRFRRLVCDYERLAETVVGLHLVALSCLMLHRLFSLLVGPTSAYQALGASAVCWR
jgi:transposase